MEIRLLTLNKFMANFSTKLVGGFVPVIVYKYTGNMMLAVLTLVIQYLVSFIFNLIFKNALIKKPQVFLMLRIIPIAIYEILLLFIEANPIWCVVGIGLAYSCSYTFKYIPNEVLFAYINASKKSGTGRSLAITKLIEQFAIIIGILLGGVALDYIDMKILIAISLALYFIGALPLLIYYLTHRKKNNLNTEYSTYEHMALKEQSLNTKYANSVSKKVRVIYCLFYFLQESWNAFYVLMPLFMFTITGKFTTSAIATAIFDGVYGIGVYIAGKLDNKRDLTIVSSISGILFGLLGISLIVIKENLLWVSYIVVGMMALLYAIAYFFMYHRMLMKSKIVGRNTTCIINKINMYFISTACIVSFGIILPIWSCFCIAGVLSICGGISSPYVEEKTRILLVDHLEDNEIRGSIMSIDDLDA